MKSKRLRPKGVLQLLFCLLATALPGGWRMAVREQPAAAAAAVPDVALQNLATGLGPVTSIAQAGDNRLFLTIQTGRILIWNGVEILSAPFLDLTSRVSCCGERGLLSVAFHPQYAQNGFFFVYYTNTAGDVVIARYSVSAANPNAANASSGVILLTIPHPTNSNHNGGQLQFGPDGYLYIGTGDGGSANDPPCNAQRDGVLLGKLLRIDVNQNVSAPPFYAVPPSNPLVGSGDPSDKIWAKGLRNPWRFSFDRSSGDLWIGDVGQDAREEIDFQPRSSRGGENYGWKVMEGTRCTNNFSNCPAGVPPCNSPLFQAPVYEYSHGTGDCSVTGGYVYRGAAIPQLSGTYVYGDYCSGRIWGNGRLFAPTAPGLTTFGEDISGELYLATLGGSLYRLVNPNPVTPTATPTVPPMVRVPGDRPRPTPRVLVRSGG